MKPALLVLLACATASAEPQRRTCKPEGSVLFEIDHRIDKGAKLPTSKHVLYGNGAFVVTGTAADGKVSPPRRGCLAKAALDQITADLKAAPWKVTRARITCKAYAASSTVYSVNGKELFTERICNGMTLDAKSQKNLEEATKLLTVNE